LGIYGHMLLLVWQRFLYPKCVLSPTSKIFIVSGLIYGLKSVAGKVAQLASYQTFRDNPDAISDDVARYENVSQDKN